jgi:pimeloyl-ACP methyl ester carboxylesterase
VKTLLTHSKVRLALHTLRDADGPALLLLHGLGERSPARTPAEFADWPGSVHALDFCGHGESTLPHGGGYTSEVLMADADLALEQIGETTVCGRGLGGYVALMLAGARPQLVRGAIVRDGPGLSGGGARPGTPTVVYPAASGTDRTPDPFALIELARDLRPPDYATAFARQATHLSGQEQPISVCARERPDWLAAVLAEPGVEDMRLADALSHYAALGVASPS